MDTERIREIAEQALSGTDRFVVGIRQLPSDEIEVTIDSDTTVGIDDCIALSRAVTGAFDRDAEDFALTVVSAGIGQPLVCERQYRKMVGREVDVVLRDGRKLTAEAKAFDGGALTLELEAYLTDRVALLLNARERMLFGSDIGKFHTQVGLGLKFIIN